MKKNKVPLRRWLVNIILFFSINFLNNHAFSYDISVPVHIILRSGGSITTIVAGYFYGKRYSKIQVVSVILLTSGVIVAAWSDAQSKVLHPPQRLAKWSLEANALVSSRLPRPSRPAAKVALLSARGSWFSW